MDQLWQFGNTKVLCWTIPDLGHDSRCCPLARPISIPHLFPRSLGCPHHALV